jgi:predicted metalloprotease with PDZ domain
VRLPRASRAAVALCFAAACAAPPAPRRRVEAPPIAHGTAHAWRYDVTASTGAKELGVEALIPPGCAATLGVPSTGRFVRGVEVSTGGPFRPLEVEREGTADARWHLPYCPPEGCRLRYRFALADAAAQVDQISAAAEVGGAVITSPSAWLLHPAVPDSQPFELRVSTPPGTTFVAGLLPAGEGAIALPPRAYAADLTDLPTAPWSAFGAMRLLRADVEGQAIDVALLPGQLDAGDEVLLAWITESARAVRGYFGRAPIRRTLLLISPEPGRGIFYARTIGNGGATIVAPLGRATTAADLAASWQLIHELLHVAFPNLESRHAWLEEGMATYVEPLIRARRGTITAEEAFAHFHRRMPYGLPLRDDHGLDNTHTWGRTYWGGALFCLLADLAIRERTENRRSLDDALGAVLAEGGNVSERWTIDEVIEAGDRATGVPVLRELYASMAPAPRDVDLDALWARLGVVGKGDGVVFDDRAPLAAVRRAMVAREAR